MYDPKLRQIQKTVGSAKTKYVYSGSRMIEEWNGANNTLTKRYVYAGADEPVLQMTSAGVVTYIHHDHHGSVIAQSNATTGAVGNKYKYGPFGESAATLPGTTIGYTGQRYDTELGLYHYKARYFHQGLGRFLQPDPIGYSAGMNLYAYCSNDGLNHTDPDGLEPDSSIDGPLGVFGPGVSYLAQPRGSVTNDALMHAVGGPIKKGVALGLKTTGRYLLETGFPQRAYVAASGHAKNFYGRLVEYAGDKTMKNKGWKVMGKNIGVKATRQNKNGQYDRLYQKGDKKKLVDWKGGTSNGSAGQLATKGAGPAGAVARGGKAKAAGLTPGKSLQSGGVTDIEIKKMKFKY
ncbi:MAG: RHS repeat-associated core domain-containing protein [Candidatus Melainabacteria bacterium]|nr:RHS repeat-associated core domain-containing protein [Candidatus Melainabacteria bacterium]